MHQELVSELNELEKKRGEAKLVGGGDIKEN